MDMRDTPPAERLLASVIHYLIQGDDRDTATVLLFCEASYGNEVYYYDEINKYTRLDEFKVYLTGPRAAYDALRRVVASEYDSDSDSIHTWMPVMEAATEAFKAVAPPGATFQGIEVRVQLVDIQPDWREELREIAQGRRAHNQGVEIPGREIIEWSNLRFRSQSEVRIARALDTVGVLFLPNCLARLNKADGRLTKEADFLVCHNGKWGILEVDGPYHPRAASDHERDRLFQQHGIRVTQRFAADECYSDAPGVVRRFLTLLERNG